MRDGIVRTRSGRRYKPSAIRSFESNLALHIYPALGAHALQDVRRGDVQRVADRLVASGRSPSTVRNALMPLPSSTAARSRSRTSASTRPPGSTSPPSKVDATASPHRPRPAR